MPSRLEQVDGALQRARRQWYAARYPAIAAVRMSRIDALLEYRRWVVLDNARRFEMGDEPA